MIAIVQMLVFLMAAVLTSIQFQCFKNFLKNLVHFWAIFGAFFRYFRGIFWVLFEYFFVLFGYFWGNFKATLGLLKGNFRATLGYFLDTFWLL